MTARSVLIVGRDDPLSLEISYARALRRLGCRVQHWNPESALSRATRGLVVGKIVSRFVHVEPWMRSANLEFLHSALSLRPDLILVVGTTGVRSGTLGQLRVLLPACLLYCIYPDSPHFLDSERIHCLPLFHRVTTSSPAWVDAFQRLGAPNVAYLPFAADTEASPLPTRIPTTIEPTCDLGFVGTWRSEREELLERLVDFDLRIWGSSYWKSRTRPGSALRRCWTGRTIGPDELPALCRSSRILLNILDASTWPGPNMRSFEHAACGAFSLETRSSALLDVFTEGQTVECFSSTEEAREKIQYYLRHDDARRRIAEAAHRFVIDAGHTYNDRARLVIGWAERDLSRLTSPAPVYRPSSFDSDPPATTRAVNDDLPDEVARRTAPAGDEA